MKIKHPKNKGTVIKLEQKYAPPEPPRKAPAPPGEEHFGIRARDLYMLLLVVVCSNTLLWLDSFDRYLSSRYHIYLAQYLPDQAYTPSRNLQDVLAMLGMNSNKETDTQQAHLPSANDGPEDSDEEIADTAPVQQPKSPVSASSVIAPGEKLAIATTRPNLPPTFISGVVDVEFPGELAASGVADASDKMPKVLFVGDSMMQGVAPIVINKMRRVYPKGTYVDLSRQSTGLTVNRYFNWPAKIREECLKQGFRTVVVFLGPNDPWDIYEGKNRYAFPSEKWEERYRSRVDEVMEFASSHGVHVIWVGLPVMRDSRLQNGAKVENKIFREEAQKYRFDFLPTDDLLGSLDEPYRKFILDPKKGKVVVRADDGIHFSPNGLRLISARVEEFLKKQD